MFFSIVVPVYNVEEYLNKCIKSILEQDFLDYEVILVDDGSTDTSGEICDKWSREYCFITAIHKSNGGLDSARKKGLELCKGEFIIFLDSDDWLADQCLYKIALKLQKLDQDVDVIQTVYSIIFPDGSTRDVNDFQAVFGEKQKISGSEFATNNFEKKVSMNNVWSKIYRRRFLQQISIPVLPKYSCEDVETLCECVIRGGCYSYVNEKMIMFRSARPGSITTSLNYNYVLGYLQTMVRLVDKIENSNLSDKVRLKKCCANMFIEECQYIEKFSKQQRKQLYNYIKDKRGIMNYVTDENETYKIYKRIGIRAGNRVISLRMKLYNLLYRR